MKLIYINKFFRKILMIFLCAIIIFGIIFIIITISKNKYVEIKEPVYKYSHKADIEYSVNMIPNPLIEEKTLAKGNTYITEFIDSVNTNMKYNFLADKKAEIKGQYEIIGRVEGFISAEKDSKSLWSKEIILQPKTDFEILDKDGEVSNELSLKINDYNDLIRVANRTLGMNFIGKFSVIWNISIEGNTEHGVFTEKLSPRIEIPLNEKYFKISGNLSDNKDGAIEKPNKVISSSFYKNVIISCILIIIGISGMIFSLKITRVKKPEKLSIRTTRSILKKYEERLVAVMYCYSEDHKEIITVMSMEDLIKIADEIEKPIFYKYSSNIEEVRKFYVEENNKVFIFEN